MLARDFVEREQVHRVGDVEAAADPHVIVHVVRTAARFLHAAHADLIVVERARRTQERIGVAVLAQAAVHHHDDVRPAGEGRQRAAVRRRQREVLDERCDLFDGGHFHGEGLRVVQT